jgi:starvation-inducible DNA-binding protein
MKKSTTNLTEAPIMYGTENDISKGSRTELNTLMNQRLASAVDLQMQMKQAHWNVKGPNFIGLHELFDKVAEAVEDYVDLIAERIVQLGGIAEGTVRVAASRTTIDEANALDDADKADLFTEISRGIDKWLWFVEGHSQAAK